MFIQEFSEKHLKFIDKNTISVLDHGIVCLIDSMPKENGDEAIVQAARVSYYSYGKSEKTVRDNRSLIRYLMRNEHTSPFEMVEFKFYLKMPFFVARQHVRHRTASINEYSGRYSIIRENFYVPEGDEIKEQSSQNKQGRGKRLEVEKGEKISEKIKNFSHQAFNLYNELIESGLAREISRIVLPLNTYTEFFWKIDLHNLLRYIRLRMDYHAQFEINLYARAMYELIKPIVPLTVEAFNDYVLEGIKLSKNERNLILKYLDKDKLKREVESSDLFGKTEREEFLKKIFETNSDQDFTNPSRKDSSSKSLHSP